MSEEEFRLIRGLIREHCGIDFQSDSQFLVERRLAPRLETLRMASFTEYYLHLRYAATREAEYEEIVERVTTNETYFFREKYQLDAFANEILLDIHASPRRPRRLHLWSAGCSTGEEPYTLAMLILESGRFAGWDVRIYANDVSRRVLDIARRGVYSRGSFRTTDERWQRRYFRAVDGKHEVIDEVKQLVTFSQANLLEDGSLARIGEVDAVFCRNVLIYFDSDSRRKVIDSFYRKLARRGYLLLGHTESLINLSTAFELVHLERDMVYRKP